MPRNSISFCFWRKQKNRQTAVFLFLVGPQGLPWHKCLRGNRNDFASLCSQNLKHVSLGINACGATVTISLRFCSQNLLVVEPFAAVAALTGSRPVAETKKPPNGGVF
ncbi:MAG: hypothetical protein IJR92_00435, partial [Alphaproteobacteria bacterium]|nr:hypothetical protein [Alphaproteobacteria bacterium]